MYRYTKTLKGVIGKYKNGDLADVKQITDLWEYLEGDFVDALYEEEWYNEGTNELEIKVLWHFHLFPKIQYLNSH